jgi:uncharacterized membrane protein YedE/YeeE
VRISSLLCVLMAGALFGFGLSEATMIKPEVVLSFLRLEDFGLLWVLGSASLVTLITYQFAPRLLRKPLLELAFGKHPAELNRETLVGAAIFGVGWGISGVCPGPAIAGLGAGNWPLVAAVASMFAGALVQGVSRRSP